MAQTRYSQYFGPPKTGPDDSLFFPGVHGIPVRAPGPAMTKDHEYDDLQITGNFDSKIFILPDDQDAYNKICDAIVKGKYIRNKEQVVFHEGKYHVFVSWIEAFAVNPKASSQSVYPSMNR